MKALAIALFIMFVTASIGLVTDLGVFDTEYAVPDEQDAWFKDMQNVSIDEDKITKNNEYSIIGSFKVGLRMFISMIKGALMVGPILMNTFGVPGSLAVLLHMGVLASYGIAAVQILLGRSIKNYE